MRDANGKITTTVFDLIGRAQATVNANGNRTTQVFDPAGRRSAVVDGRANRTTFLYNGADWQTTQIDPLSRRTTLGYDNNGRQTLRLDARGFRITLVFDAIDNPTGKRYPDGSRATFAYNALADRTLMQNSTGRTTFAYDLARRLSSVINPANKRVSYGYDLASQRTLLIEPGSGRFSYAWDAAGRSDYLVDPQGYRTTWVFDAASRVVAQRLGNGVRVSYTHDDADRLLKLVNITSGGTTLSSFAYALDAVGNRTRVVEADGTPVTWIYDNTYQLLRETRSGSHAYDITYSYDPAGNRKTMLTGGVRTTYTADAANQLTSYQDNTGTTNLGFDAAGNQTTQVTPAGSRTTSSWDYENHLTQVVLPLGVPNSFLYDPDGKRLQKQDSSGTTKEVWDMQNVLEETDSNDVTQVIYTLGLAEYGNLISQNRGSGAQFFHFDGLGSVNQLTDSNAMVTDSYLYQGFGAIIPVLVPSTNPFRFVGRQGYYLDSDLATYWLRARIYVPVAGRFISQDPLGLGQYGFRLSALDSQNLYWYAANNPITMIDPFGTQAKCCCCVTNAEIRGDKRIHDRKFFGHQFDAHADFKYLQCGTEEKCGLNWAEKSDRIPLSYIEKGLYRRRREIGEYNKGSGGYSKLKRQAV